MRHSNGLHILSFACQRNPFLGRSLRRIILPFVSCQGWHGWLLPIIVYFYKVYLNTFDVWFFWILIRVQSGQFLEGSAPFLRVLLIFWYQWRFWRVFRSDQGIFGRFSLTDNVRTSCWGFPDALSSCWYLFLYLGWYLPLLSFGGFL